MIYYFRAFVAAEDQTACEHFQRGHSKILDDFNIKKLTSNEESWILSKNVIVITALDEGGEIVGGIRVHKYDGSEYVPLIRAIEFLDARIKSVFDAHLPIGTAESCGLWNAKKVFGKGLSPLLARCSVVASAYFGVNSLYGFSAPYTLNMIGALGFVPVAEIGNNGQFPYPNERYISTVLRIPDVFRLQNANQLDKNRILDLMQTPVQRYTENSQGKSVEIQYNLLHSIDVVSGKNRIEL